MASIMGKGLPHFPAEGARGRINCAVSFSEGGCTKLTGDDAGGAIVF
ncbi:hypothetical protein [Sphingomonas sp. OTU376]